MIQKQKKHQTTTSSGYTTLLSDKAEQNVPASQSNSRITILKHHLDSFSLLGENVRILVETVHLSLYQTLSWLSRERTLRQLFCNSCLSMSLGYAGNGHELRYLVNFCNYVQTGYIIVAIAFSNKVTNPTSL